MISTRLPVGMIADDLTGACDTGVQFAKRGLRSTVCFNLDAFNASTADVIILSSDSRADNPQMAMGKVDYLCQQLQSKGIPLFYKKIDSTLRGQVGAEIESAMHATGCTLAVVTPAFPIMGRTVVDGWLQIAGPDPIKPLHLPTYLHEQSEIPVEHLSIKALETGLLAKRIAEADRAKPLILAVDARSDEHLARIATAVLHAPYALLMAGSGGLGDQVAAQLAEHFGHVPTSAARVANAQQPDKRPVVLFIGSNAIATQRQIEQLCASEQVNRIRLGIDDLETIPQLLQQGNHLLISLRWNAPDNRENLQSCLALLGQEAIAGMIISGGDTARLVCDAAGIQGIQLEEELLPGLPWGRMIGGEWVGMPICTKSGRFGKEDAFVQVVEFISRQSRQRL